MTVKDHGNKLFMDWTFPHSIQCLTILSTPAELSYRLYFRGVAYTMLVGNTLHGIHLLL